MDNLKFVYPIYIDTTPQNLWQALTKAEYTKKYFFGRRLETTGKIRSSLKYWDDDKVDIFGEVLVFEPEKRFSYTFKHDLDPNKREQPTVVTLKLNQLVHLCG